MNVHTIQYTHTYNTQNKDICTYTLYQALIIMESCPADSHSVHVWESVYKFGSPYFVNKYYVLCSNGV